MTVARYIRMFNTLEAGEQREYDVLSLAGKEFCVYNGVLSGSFLVLTHLNPVCFCFVQEELCRRECYRQSRFLMICVDLVVQMWNSWLMLGIQL